MLDARRKEMFKKLSLVILVSYGLIFCSRAQAEEDNDRNELLNNAISVLNKTFDFVLKHHKLMNVDGILGINIAHAHLVKILENKIKPDIKGNIELLKEKAHTIYITQAPNLPNTPWKYFVFNQYVLPIKFWLKDIEFSYGILNSSLQVDIEQYNVTDRFEYDRYIHASIFEESTSDSCLVEIATAFNPITDTNPRYYPASKKCYDYLVEMPEPYDTRIAGYGVTHQLLYLQLARAYNLIVDKQQTNHINKKCSYILWELKKNVDFGYIPGLFDLFVEQIILCGYEGFAEFLKQEYLEHILEEQNEYGGFGVAIIDPNQLKNKTRKRTKRESIFMPHGANSHTTGLAAGAIALFIRLLLKKPFNNM